MFEGEYASLEAILSTNTIRVPRPVKVVDLDEGGAVFIMEHVDMKSLNRLVTCTSRCEEASEKDNSDVRT